jgi:hypothetical protein
MSVGHSKQNVTFCGFIAGNQQLIWHKKGSLKGKSKISPNRLNQHQGI